jgi:hypothetical protein
MVPRNVALNLPQIDLNVILYFVFTHSPKAKIVVVETSRIGETVAVFSHPEI